MITDYAAVIALYAVPLLLGVIAHEVAHGWVAEKLGDPTARLMGRITLNPLVHIDPFGTVLLPLMLIIAHSPFLFGWAKPVPINFANLRGGRRDSALVAAAGPATNLVLAIFSAVLYHFLLACFQRGWIPSGGEALKIADPLLRMAELSVAFNVVLMTINLIPIPPLDGGRIAVGLLPGRAAAILQSLERYGMLILLILIMTGTLGNVIMPVRKALLSLLLG